MKAKFLGLLACVAMGVVVADPSHATTLVGTTSDAMGFDGLVVDGVTYNVTFINNDYSTVYASIPTFLGNTSGALEAAAALASALNAFSVTALEGESLGPNYFLLVPYSNNSGVNTSAFDECGNSPCLSPYAWGSANPGVVPDATVSGVYDYTVFTPLPAALPLFATVLGVGGLLGWRRKRKNTAAVAA